MPVSLDTLEMTVDSIMEEIDKKIKTDSMYFYSNRLNREESNVMYFLQSESGIFIKGWWYCGMIWRPPLERPNISDYNNLRDWYHANKKSINWFTDAESAMEVCGYILKRDSTGVYAEQDTTLLPPSVLKNN